MSLLLDLTAPTISRSDLDESRFERNFNKKCHYSVSAVQIAQKVLFGIGFTAAIGGMLVVPFVDGREAKQAVLSYAFDLVVPSLAGSALNWLFYNVLYKPYHPEDSFHFVRGIVVVPLTEV